MPTKNLRPERRDIPIEQLELDPHPVRPAMLIDDAEDRQFVESVNEFGVLWPIAVEDMDEGRYRILDGQRRFLSAKRLRLSTVPCLIFRKLNKADRASLHWILQHWFKGRKRKRA